MTTVAQTTLTSTEVKDTLSSLPVGDKFKTDPFYARHRFDSDSSNDSGFEGLEHLEPLDFDDLRPVSSTDYRYGFCHVCCLAICATQNFTFCFTFRYKKRVSFDITG